MNIGGALKRAHEFAGVAAFVGAVAVGTGFTLRPPWPSHGEFELLRSSGDQTRQIIEAVQRQQTEQIRSSERQNCIILQLLKDRYLKEQLDAQEELNKNPTSPTLQRARDEAKANVENLDTEQRTSRCLRLRAPISSSTAPSQTDRLWIMAPSTRSTPLKL